MCSAVGASRRPGIQVKVNVHWGKNAVFHDDEKLHVFVVTLNT